MFLWVFFSFISGSTLLPSRPLSMSADCVFSADIDFVSSATGRMDIKSGDELQLSVSTEVLAHVMTFSYLVVVFCL